MSQTRDTPKDARELARETREAELLRRLAELGGDQFRDESVIFSGRQLVVPEGMTLAQAREYLARKEEEDEEQTIFSRTFPFRPYDGAVTAYAALHDVFGSVLQRSSFFNQAQSITVPTDANGGTVQVPFGGYFSIPLMPDTEMIFTSGQDEEHGTVFVLAARGPRKRRYQMEGIFRVVGEALAAKSLYRGQAIDGKEMPGFIDLSAVDPDSVIYSEEVRTQLEANIWTPIRHASVCRDLGVPLKRAVLVYGPFGTGKTLAAYLTARVATANGWTFLYARPGKDDLLDVLRTARLYQPAVVFFEDADVISDPARTDQDGVSVLLDAFDGITAKGTEIIAVLTTNYPERIHKGMIRPGRLDAVVRIGEWDAAGYVSMIRKAVPAEHLAEPLDEAAIGSAFDGFLPAFVREAIDRAMRYALARNHGDAEGITLDAEDFVQAAHGLRPQIELMEEAPENEVRVTIDGLVADAARGAAAAAVRATLDPAALDARGQAFLLPEEVTADLLKR